MKNIILLIMCVAGICATAQEYVFQKVDKEPGDWSGEYLIVRENDDMDDVEVFDGSNATLDRKKNTIHATAEHRASGRRYIMGDKTLCSATFTISKTGDDTYSIRSHSGFYIGYNKAGAFEADLKSNPSKPSENSIAMENGKTNVAIRSKNGFFLRFNADPESLRFRYYAKGKKKAIKLYKKIELDTHTNK